MEEDKILNSATIEGAGVEGKDQVNKLREELEKENQKKTEGCSKELKELLDRHGCDLDVRITITSKGFYPSVIVVAKE